MQNFLLIISAPRSGSHWLADNLRAHPRIAYLKNRTVHPALGLVGNRYARDLCVDDADGIEIENNDNHYVRIRRLELPAALVDDARLAVRPHWHLENFHPQMFGFDTPAFVQRLQAFCARREVRVLFRVREPRECIRSYLDYKERVPDWGGPMAPEDLIPHYRKTFEAMLEIAAVIPSMVVPYEQQGAAVFARIYDFIWPDRSADECALDKVLIEHIAAATDRAARQNASPKFFAAAGQQRETARYEPLFERFDNDVAACANALRELHKIATA